jgi:hypothetical protein
MPTCTREASSCASRRSVAEQHVFAFVLWSNVSHDQAEEILADIRTRFTLLDLLRVTWSEETFASSLARLYGDRLPSAEEKAARCGTGPFLCAVIADRPAYRLRRTRRRFERVNKHLFAARERYRGLTQSHDLVHATMDDAEAARDLFLITHRERDSFRGSHAPDEARPLERDLLGTHGWEDETQLVRALELAGGCRRVAGDGLTLAVGDLWWASRLLFLSDATQARGVVSVGGAPVEVTLVER